MLTFDLGRVALPVHYVISNKSTSKLHNIYTFKNVQLFDSFNLTTLVRLSMKGNIVAGKNNGGYKFGGIAENPSNLTRHYFTCNIIFTKKFVNPPNFTCHIAKFYSIFFPDCVFFCSFKVK